VRGHSSGFALLTAIWVLAVLMIMVAGFALMAHSEIDVTNNYGDAASARWAAHAGIRDAESQVISLASESYTALGGPQLVTTGPTSTGALGNATYTLTIQDEASKININTASATLLDTFFAPDVATNIITWRSPSSANAGGAGDSYYNTLSPPYNCKYAPFDTIDELMLVKGVTPDALSLPTDTVDGLTLRDMLTTSSYDTNTTVTGARRININTASATSLAALLKIPVSSVPSRRDYTSPAAVLTWNGVKSSTVATVYDQLTATTATSLPGLVNLNTASAEVLAALPGMDATIAQDIIQYRTSKGEFATVGDLLSVSAVTTTVFQAVASSLTVRSRLFRVIVTGQSADGLTATVSCLMQTTTSSSGTSATSSASASSSTSASTSANTGIVITYWQE
jgi:general secretion pathway protein K